MSRATDPGATKRPGMRTAKDAKFAKRSGRT